ncbi:MAG TPA: hypothetical protein VK864_20200, partial [Longimicrobiales bacterium]|nr:hypothetical protein [Longimicrobiales bacterium]
LIPVLPAVFLLHPGIWRNVCPLATLNLLPRRHSLGWRLDANLAKWGMLASVALLAILVPARRFVFNLDGRALTIVIATVALLALALGFLFDRKAGFCNFICPVLPVEKLYGQDPIARVSNPHCPSCSVCTARSCLDLAPRKALGLSRRSSAASFWPLAPHGAFAAAFPGFVVAYYLVPNTTLPHAGEVYAKIAAGAALSFIVIALLARVLRLHAEHAVPVLGGGTLVLYYWFGAASIAKEWELGFSFVLAIRTLAIALVTYWLARRLRYTGSNGPRSAVSLHTTSGMPA